MSKFAPDPRSLAPGRYAPETLDASESEPSRSIGAHEAERTACGALMLPYAADVPEGEALHRVGTFRIGDNPAAVARLIDYSRRIQHTNTFSFAEYVDACRHVSTLQNKRMREEREMLTRGNVLQSLLSERERTFLHFYLPGLFTPDIGGFAAYQALFSSDLAALLQHDVPAYIPESARKEHTFICASSGYGKTELFKTFIQSYVKQPDIAAVVAIDPAGDYVNQIAHWPEFVGFGSSRLALR